MKMKAMVAAEAHHHTGTFPGGLVALSAAALFLILTAANAAGPGGAGPVGKSPHVMIEKIPGMDAPRITLTAKAAERLGIQTGKVTEERIVKKQMVGGLVIPPMQKGQLVGARPATMRTSFAFAGSGKRGAAPGPEASVAPKATPPEAGDVWVLVTLAPGEWDKLAKDEAVRLVPLGTRDPFSGEVLAQPSGMAPVEDMKRSMLRVYYVVSGKDQGLEVNQLVRVELPLAGTDEKQKVVPYSAVFYDSKGTPWVYVNTGPLTYERQRIEVERVVGDLTILSDGPPLGTPVVTVGASMLHGAEIFKK